MTLRQSQFVIPVPLAVAEHAGLLEKSGVDLAATRTRGSAEQLSQFLDGTIEMAVTATDNLIVWNRAGADVRVIAQVEATTPLTLFARAPFATIRSLEGRRLAVDASTNGFALTALAMFAREHISPRLVEVGGVKERLDALLSGEADATLLGPPFDTIGTAAGLIPLDSVNTRFPDYPGQALVVSRLAHTNQRDEIDAYLAALRESVHLADALEDVSGAEILVERGFPAPAAVAAWRARPRTIEPSASGLAAIVEIRRSLGLLPPDFVGIEELRDFEARS